MKKTIVFLSCLTLVFVFSNLASAAKNVCSNIQSGALTDVVGNQITLGYDLWGYNYQAHMFNGFYDNYSRPATPATGGDSLEMKWNDAWLSNKDCDGDGKLDRHYGFSSYIGSGAWLTNHQSGTYLGDNGQVCHYTYFVKIVAAPADASSSGGIWYTGSGEPIGPAIWGDFAVIQEISNDSCTGDHGVLFKSPVPPGFGTYRP